MRSRITTHLLLLLAFLFVLAIIILCLIPAKHYGEGGGETSPYDGPRDRTHESTTTHRTTLQTTSSSDSTEVHTTESTLPPSTTSSVSDSLQPIVESTSKSTTTSPTGATTASTTTTYQYSTTTSTMAYFSKPVNETTTAYATESASTSTTTANASYSLQPIIESTAKSTSTSTTGSTSTSTTVTTVSHFSKPIIESTTQSTTSSTTESTSPSTTTSTKSHFSKPIIASSTVSTTESTSPATTTANTSYSLQPIIESTDKSTSTSTTESTSTSTISTTESPFSKPIDKLTTESTTESTTAPTTTHTTESTTESTAAPTTTRTTESTTMFTTSKAITKYILKGACSSNDCKTIASRMLDMIDHSADPCQDFYQYSCGGVENDPFLSPEDPELALDSVIKEQMFNSENDVLKFFETCRTSLKTNSSNFDASFIENREISFNDSGVNDVSSLLIELMKNGLAPIFDITVETLDSYGLKFVPRFGFPVLETPTLDREDKKLCLNKLENKMKLDVRQGHKSVKLTERYKDYLHCMQNPGIDARIERIKEAVNNLNLFALNLEDHEKDNIFDDTKIFLTEVISVVPHPSQDHSEVVTVGDLNHELGSFNEIDWSSFLRSLTGNEHLNSNDEVVIHHKKELRDLFQKIHKNYDSRDLENMLLVLWAERTHIKSQLSLESITEYCFQAAKSLLPDEAKVLFINSFTASEMEELQNQVSLLGITIAEEIIKMVNETKNTRVDFDIMKNFYVEVENMNLTSLHHRIDNRKKEIPLTNIHVDNFNKLQRKLRKDMYSLIGKKPENSKDCWFLPRFMYSDCHSKFNEIVVPMSYLVTPNLYFEKEVPNYLKFAGIAEFVAQKYLQHANGSDLAIGKGDPLSCFTNEINKPIVVENPMNVEASISVNTNHVEELLLALKSAHISWRSLKLLDQSSEHVEINETQESTLVWLGSTPLSPIKAFLIKNAQILCEPTSDFNVLKIVEEDHLPARFKVNALARNDPLFSTTFECPSGTVMSFQEKCSVPETTTAAPVLTTYIGTLREN